jgi:hypothetical protein
MLALNRARLADLGELLDQMDRNSETEAAALDWHAGGDVGPEAGQ